MVAPIHGTAVGATFAIALACHGRDAADTTQFGLLEVALP